MDFQNDFCPGGALAVPTGDVIGGRVNELAGSGERSTSSSPRPRDWHPPDHGSFTSGRPLAGALRRGHAAAPSSPRARPGARRGGRRQGPAPRHRGLLGLRRHPLAELLRERDVDHVTVVGLATDYCVKNTALDALREGFAVTVDSRRPRRRHRTRRLRAGAGRAARCGSERGLTSTAASERLVRTLRRHILDQRVSRRLRQCRAIASCRVICCRRRGTTSRCRSGRARRSPSRWSSRACASCSSSRARNPCSTSAPARATTPRCSPGWPARVLDRGPRVAVALGGGQPTGGGRGERDAHDRRRVPWAARARALRRDQRRRRGRRGLPPALPAQLRPGGRLVAPVDKGEQRLVVARRTDAGVTLTELERVRFVPLVTR